MIGWWAVSGYVWLNRMGKALTRFDPMFIIPLLQVDFILLAIVSGGIYFQEFEDFRFQEAAGFVSGVLLVCGGLYCLAPKQVARTKLCFLFVNQYSLVLLLSVPFLLNEIQYLFADLLLDWKGRGRGR